MNIYDNSPLDEWMSDFFLRPNEQFFNYIMASASCIQWHDDDVRFVLYQYA